jgi:hypothetical protein
VSRNQKNQAKEVPNPHRDLPGQARLALVDYLAELKRQTKGVRLMPKSANIPDPFKVPFQTPEDTGIKGRAVPKLKNTRQLSPAKSFVAALGVDGKTMNEVAKELGISRTYMLKLLEVESLKAPSLVAPFGSRKIYVYTPEDREELREYLARERTAVPRRPGVHDRSKGSPHRSTD